MTTLAPGTPLFVSGVDAQPLVAIGTLDPRNAAAAVLAAYLRQASFARDNGDMPGDKVFALEKVYSEWPDPKVPIQYPSASITDAGGVPQSAALTPVMLDASFGVWCADTVLWKTAELSASFQVDFFTTDTPTREGIAARLPALFSPEEGRGGVLLAGDPRYFCASVRATLVDVGQRMDTPEAVFGRERRLRTLIQCDIAVLQLRRAVMFSPRVVLSDQDP